jgi:hypothetical protein
MNIMVNNFLQQSQERQPAGKLNQARRLMLTMAIRVGLTVIAARASAAPCGLIETASMAAAARDWAA